MLLPAITRSVEQVLGKTKQHVRLPNCESERPGRALRDSPLALSRSVTIRSAYFLNDSSTLNRPPPRNISANAAPISATLYSMPWPLLGSFAQFKKKPLGK